MPDLHIKPGPDAAPLGLSNATLQSHPQAPGTPASIPAASPSTCVPLPSCWPSRLRRRSPKRPSGASVCHASSGSTVRTRPCADETVYRWRPRMVRTYDVCVWLHVCEDEVREVPSPPPPDEPRIRLTDRPPSPATGTRSASRAEAAAPPPTPTPTRRPRRRPATRPTRRPPACTRSSRPRASSTSAPRSTTTTSTTSR